MPERVQIRRDRPWQREPKAIKVDRTTRWGNPVKIGDLWCGIPIATRQEAVSAFRSLVAANPTYRAEAAYELSGRDLACWCPPGEPCHADVLLEIANPS